MNYRHHYHAGNFADVMKHVLLIRLIRAMQRKERGFLLVDTHAGRGSYDLTLAGRGDTLVRRPEWPDGIGRLAGGGDLPTPLADYWTLVVEHDRRIGNAAAEVRYLPGSPVLARELARPQDRLALCELQAGEFAALEREFESSPKASVHCMDGYQAVRAFLPPPEKRALVLIDPPFEAPNEWDRITETLREGLRRLPAGVFVIWYPLTDRAKAEAILPGRLGVKLPPTLLAELTIAGVGTSPKLKGCGLLVVNPPWRFEEEAGPILRHLADALAQSPGGGGRIVWIVPEDAASK